LLINETFEKRSILFKLKEDDPPQADNHRNILNILRINHATA